MTPEEDKLAFNELLDVWSEMLSLVEGPDGCSDVEYDEDDA